MTFRTSANALNSLIGKTIDSTLTEHFRVTAHRIVVDNLTNAGHSEDTLAEIEKYLSAHLLSLHPEYRILKEEKIGEARNIYGGKFGMGLDATQFGQTAQMLDTTGLLSQIGYQRAEIDVIDLDYV